MIADKITEMGDNLRLLEGHDRLHYLIDNAKGMEPLPEAAKIDDNRIRGCASKLWIIGGAKEDGTMMYQVDGDAHISKGTAKIVTDIVNGEPKNEVANLTVESFTPLGIKELLTMQRQNGLGELINRIIRIAHD